MTSAAVEPSQRRFSVLHLLLLLPWIVLVIDAFAPIQDNSFLWHIRAGELQAEAGRVLTADPFSFTMFGEPWLTQSWLAELLYSWGEAMTDLAFVAPMMLVLSGLTLSGLGLIAYRRSKSVAVTLVLLVLSTALLMRFLVPRPVIFSFALFVLVILAWDHKPARWTLPLLFWIWASVHGSFAIGLAYVGLSLLSRRDWRALPTAFVSGIVTLATAHGLGVLTMLFEFAEAREALSALAEWRRPELIGLVFTPFLIGTALLVIGGLRGKIRVADAWVIVPFVVLAFTATRAVPPAWLALVPLMATSLEGLDLRLPRRFSMVSTSVFTAVVLLVPFLLVAAPALDETRFPIEATSELETVSTFHDDRAGGYLIWASGPEFLVYLDDRAELYQERIVEFAGIRAGEVAWEPVFERDGIEQVMLRADESLIGELEASGWARAHEDDEYVILRP